MCRALRIGLTAYGILSRGLLSGRWSRDRHPTQGDFRVHAPRFQRDNLDRNLRLVEALDRIAEEKGVPVAQLAIAWVLARGDDIVPLVGSRTREQLGEALAALDVTLSPEDLSRIEEAVPVGAAAGERYAPAGMAQLDSERGAGG